MKCPVEYIRQDIPAFEAPAYGGQRYEALVPDTLDIQERASLAINGLTGPTDASLDYPIYFWVDFRTNPPFMRHSNSDYCVAKFEESLPLVRMISGSNLNEHVDRVWMENALKQIGPDGQVCWQIFRWIDKVPWGVEYAGTGKERRYPADKFYSIPQMTGRRIGAMTIYRERDPGGPWDGEIRRIVDGLWDIVMDKGDYAYFPQGVFGPGHKRVRAAAIPVGIWASLVGWTIEGLAQYYRQSGYERASVLAQKLSSYLVFHGRYYGPNGEFLPNYAGDDGGLVEGRAGFQGFYPSDAEAKNYTHFQIHVVSLLGMLDYASAVEDQDLIRFVQKSFEWAMGKGIKEVGYFPENIDRPDLQTSELCEVAGMIGLAIKLSALGVGDYWDDADRWIRNQFAEGQLLRADWAYGEVARGPKKWNLKFDPVVNSYDRVPERNIGAFAGWPTANDWGWGIMHCCTGNATRALYYIWEHMLSYEQGTLSVNLLLNRPSQWADVHSHIPYTGQVDVIVKKKCALRVRIPEWTQPGDVRCAINGKRRRLSWNGRYALIGEVRAKDMVSVCFPIAERTAEVDIEKQKYRLVTKGNDVVKISPKANIARCINGTTCGVTPQGGGR